MYAGSFGGTADEWGWNSVSFAPDLLTGGADASVRGWIALGYTTPGNILQASLLQALQDPCAYKGYAQLNAKSLEKLPGAGP